MSDFRTPYEPALGPRAGGLNQIDTDLQLILQAVNRLTAALAGNPAVAGVGTTTQKNALVLPKTGSLFYDITLGHLQTNTGTPNAPVWSNP